MRIHFKVMKVFISFVVLWCIVKCDNRSSRRYSLSVRQIKQQTDYYSGPAAAESILRYFELTPEILGIKDNNQIYQTFLANQMWTDFYRSTSTYNWWQAMNHFIQIYNLNFARPYELREVKAGYDDKEEFFKIVTLSLANNVPVVLVTGSAQRRFLIVTAVTGNAEHATYNYVNPLDGNFHFFQSSFLPFIFVGSEHPDASVMPNHILAYLPENSELNTKSRFGRQSSSSTKCSFLVLPSYILSAYNEHGQLIVPPLNPPHQTQFMRRRRQIQSEFEIVPTSPPTSCVTIDIENPYRDPDDHVRVWFRLLAHNGIEVKMSRESAINLIKIYIEHDRKTFLDYATSFLGKIIQVGSVLDTDHQHGAQVLYEGMPYLHREIARLTNEENFLKRRFVFLQTYRTFTFQETVKKRGMERTVFVSTGENV